MKSDAAGDAMKYDGVNPETLLVLSEGGFATSRFGRKAAGPALYDLSRQQALEAAGLSE